MKIALVLLGTLLLTVSLAAQEASRKPAKERVVFQTKWGNLVFALYPEVAPAHVKQILNLVQAGAYDGTHIYRVELNFVLQSSTIHHRLQSLTAEQKQLEKKLKAEISTTLKHTKGVLSMARGQDPASATSSFSILLMDAPHLDGKYTIFGHLESGATTVNRILSLPRRGYKPLERVTVLRAFIHRNIEQYYASHPIDPAEWIGKDVEPQPEQLERAMSRQAQDETVEGHTKAFIAFALSILLIGLAGFFLYERIDKSYLLSLLMLNAFIAGFGLFIFATPLGHNNSWLAVLIFVGLIAMFKFMNRFESKNKAK